VKDEMDKILGEADVFSITGERPQITDDAQRALDWAVNKKLKSGLFLPYFSFSIVCHQLQKSRKLFAKPRPCRLML
jgi:hypothetical protein